MAEEERVIEVASALEAVEDSMDVDAQTWFDTQERADLMRKRGTRLEEVEADVEILERDPSFVLGTEDIRMLVADAVAGNRMTEMVFGHVSRAWRRAIGAFARPRQRRSKGFRALCRDAAGRGDLSVLQWLRRHGCPWGPETCAAAAEAGHLAVLQWARENGCPWDKDAVVLAFRGGHIEVLEWMRANDWPVCDDDRKARAAAERGHLEVLKWLNKSSSAGLAGHTMASAIDLAAKGGYLDIVKWAVEECGRRLRSPETCTLAVQSGHLELVKWVHAHGSPWSRDAVITAAEYDRLEILKWADREVDYVPNLLDELPVARAAKTGNLDLVQYLAARGYSLMSDGICSNAAASGSLETLKWARGNGCTWDERTCSEAAFHGHLEILQWCRERGCPWDEGTCLDAAEQGHLEILQWAHAHGCPWSEDVCAQAASGGHLDVLKWLHANGCPWDGRVTAAAAARNRLEVLQWLRSQDCPWDIRVLTEGRGEAWRWALANDVPGAAVFRQWEENSSDEETGE